jgi:DnaJ-class molecular chaperone
MGGDAILIDYIVEEIEPEFVDRAFDDDFGFRYGRVSAEEWIEEVAKQEGCLLRDKISDHLTYVLNDMKAKGEYPPKRAEWIECPACDGVGNIDTTDGVDRPRRCPACRGSGYVKEDA